MVRIRRIEESRVDARATRSGLSVAEWLVVIAILAVLVALLIPARRGAGEAAWRSQCKNNLKQIVMALHNYEADFGVLPPACTVDADGEPLQSWRTLILPYLDQESLYRSIDLTRPWDHEVNRTARNTRLSAYRCRSRDVDNQSATTYLAVVTPDSCMGSTDGCSISDADGDLRETLLIVEAGPLYAVPWMAPVDADESLLEKLRPENAQPHRGGLNVAYADGSARFLSIETTQDEWLRLISMTKSDD